MPKKPENMTLDELEAQRAQIASAIKAKRRQDRAQARKDADGRKIVAGAIVLKHMEHDEAFRAQITTLFEKFATRPRDRQLLGLASPSATQSAPPAATASEASTGEGQQSKSRFPHAPSSNSS